MSDETLFDNTYKKDDVINKLFKLTSNKSLTNLHLYNREGSINKYDTIYQIMDEHFYTRYDMYKQRKLYQVDQLEKEIKLLSSRLKFINYVIEDKIQVYKRSKQSIIDSLKENEFPLYVNDEIVDYNKDKGGKEVKTEYNYLLNLSVYSFTLEKVEELENDIEKLQKDLEIIVNTEEKDIWIRELDAFEQMYKKN